MVMSLPEAMAWVARLRATGRRIVFANGVFDLLHPGHVRYLTEARRQGDVLIVAINGDRSARAQTGSNRPVNTGADRAEVVAALSAVDAVVVFDEDAPDAIISALQPDVLANGADRADEAAAKTLQRVRAVGK